MDDGVEETNAAELIREHGQRKKLKKITIEGMVNMVATLMIKELQTLGYNFREDDVNLAKANVEGQIRER